MGRGAEVTPCPLCWLHVHGFPEISFLNHTKEDWEWLRVHAEDPKVRGVLDNLPSGIAEEEE